MATIRILIGAALVAALILACDTEIECKRVARDAFHYPQEYQPGSGNWHRAKSLGIEPQHISTLAPALADCEG